MNLKKSQDRISELMALFVLRVKGEGKTGRTDMKRVSENILAQLLSEIYGHTELKILDVSEGSNFPGIDLGDKKAKIAYQITSRRDSKKIKDTLRKFVKNKLYEEYDRLVIYILTEKREYQGRGFDEIIQGKFSFDKKNDILDYQDLLGEISGFSSVDKLRKIENILEEHFGEPEYTRPLDPLDWLGKVNNLWGEELATIKIDREQLCNDLQNFALRGNGVVIGSPGVGKTYLLKELRQSLKSDGVPHLLLPIDQLGDGTEKVLREELSYEGDLIEKLKSIPVSDQKAILLFDAFDAARNEETRIRFLRLIQRTIQELNGLWNVVVTVRTYDAEKSQELLDLFGNLDNTNSTQYQDEEILCRHFIVPPLNEDEIRQTFDQIPHLESVYNDGSPELKQLLATPFNLWLLEKILKTSQDVRPLSQIRSEVQLLGLFWQRRVENKSDVDHRQFLLEQVACQMVKEHSLTVRRRDVYKDLGLDNPVRQTAWENLRSDEILAMVSSTGQRIAFSHNILFDYAISVLFIDDDPRQLEDFIREDPSRPLFLRPSLAYFFTRLWYNDPERFWAAFWHILPNDQFVHLRLFARLVPTSVIANEARSIEQLKALLDKLKNCEGIANKAMSYLLQSLRTLEIERDPLWIDFFDQASAYLHPDFAWDLATLTSEILERAKTEDTSVIDACGRVGRRLLGWIWEEREPGKDDWYNRLGGSWIVPLVAKTYGTNVEESRTLLEKVLELIQEDNFPINFLRWLVEHVDKIWIYDPEFVALVFHTVFTYNETSDERIHMGGFIVSMASTRRQNYKMCRYRLIKHFPGFLEAAPLLATRAVIQTLNLFIINTRIFSYRRGDAVRKETFSFRGKSVYFVQDYSHVWDKEKNHDKPIEMAEVLFEFIEELAKSKDSRLNEVLDVFYDHVEVAFFWKHLLKTAAQFPEIFAPHLFELCIEKTIHVSNEVVDELCTFLQIAISEFTPEQQLQIETNILELPRGDEKNCLFLERRRNQLLTQIPPDLLHTDAAKEIREEAEREDDIPKNQPPVSFNYWSKSYAEEKQLQEQGVDTTTPENQELQHFFGPLDRFYSDWLNKTPTEETTELILPRLQEVYSSIKRNTGADKVVVDTLWYKLITCTAILARLADNPEGLLFTFCRRVLLDGAKHELPKPNPELDAQFNSPDYCPFPRYEAAYRLLRLTVHHADAEVLDAIETLASDPVPSVRMATAMELFMVYVNAPGRFWDIVDNRTTHETNQVVQGRLCTTLRRVITRDEEKTIHSINKILNHTLSSTETLEPVEPCVNLLMWLAINRENSWALQTIQDTLFDAPIRFANSLKHAVFWVMKNYVIPKNLQTPQEHERVKRAIAWVAEAIDAAYSGINILCTTPKEHWTEELNQQLHNVYEVIDGVIMRLNLEVVDKTGESPESVEEISNELCCRFYGEVKPLMERVIAFAQDRESGIMFASTAHYFMELLTSFLTCNPKEVLHLAEGVARSSERFDYNLDSLAVEDVVQLVEIVLADHRNEVRDGEGLEDLLNLLDIFAKTGWSDALRLVWRLDEFFGRFNPG